MKNIAIIGTAGRSKGSAADKPMTLALWEAMVMDARKRFDNSRGYNLISGGAAWCDHIAVELASYVDSLTLHFPAPFNMDTRKFEGEYGTSGGTANFYHDKFDKVLGYRARDAIHDRLPPFNDAVYSDLPVAKGYAAMFDRNKRVAQDATDGMLAYTWGEGDEPADGGTLLTWNHHKKVHPNARRVHVPLGRLL